MFDLPIWAFDTPWMCEWGVVIVTLGVSLSVFWRGLRRSNLR